MSVEAIAEILTDIAPQYTAEYRDRPARIQRFIGRAQDEVNSDILGTNYNEAVAYLTAHRLTMASQSVADVGGQLVSARLDNGAKSFAQVDTTQSPHGETKYGREFDRIMSKAPVAPDVLTFDIGFTGIPGGH